MESSSSLPQPPDDTSSQFVSRRPPPRLTLTLPPPRATSKGLSKAPKGKAAAYADSPIQKIPRPIKLKPLKDVLAKLIAQVKKSDTLIMLLGRTSGEC